MSSTEPDAPRSSRPQQWGLWLAVVAGLALRLFRLGHQSLWTDEVFTWLTSFPHEPMPLVELLDDFHGPGVSFFLHGWMQVFGQSEWALRLPMAIASAALVLPIAAIARAAAGPRAALAAAWLAAVSPFFVWYGQESRNYAFAMLFGAIQVWAVLRYREDGRVRWAIALALAAALGALSNLNTLLLLPALLLLLVVAPPEAARARPFGRFIAPLAIGAFVAVVVAPWFLAHFGFFEVHRLVPGRVEPPSEAPLRGTTTFRWIALPYALFTYCVGFSLGPGVRELREHATWSAIAPHLPVVAAAAIAFGALAVLGVRRLRDRPFALATLLVAVAAPLALVSYLALMNFKPFNPRYASVGAPAWIALLGVGWSALEPAFRRVARLWVFGLWAIALSAHYFDPRYAKDDFRAATAAIARELKPGDAVVAAGDRTPFAYYWQDREPPVRSYWLGWALDDRRDAKFAGVRSAGGTTWVTVARAWDLDPQGRFEAWLSDSLHAEVRNFPGIRLYRVSPRGVSP